MLFRGKNRIAIFNTRISNYSNYPTQNFRVTRMLSLSSGSDGLMMAAAAAIKALVYPGGIV
jgi:hypothetical protein